MKQWKRRILTVALLVTLTSIPVGHAQNAGSGPTAVGTCEAHLDQLETANAATLFGAALTCAQEGDEFNSSLFLVTGQVRGLVDLTLLQPVDREGERVAAELYAAIFYHFGGLGPDSVYVNPEAAQNLYEQFAAWRPAFGPDYSPGWAFAPSDRHALYEEVAEEQIAERLYQVQLHTAVMADDRYRAVNDELERVTREAGGVFQQGTELYERSGELRRRMNELRDEIAADLPPPPPSQSVLDALPPEIDPSVRQLYTGLNGPADSGWALITREAEAQESWLSRAIPRESLQDLVSQVDFESEALLVVWIGDQRNATGTILIQDLDYDASTSTWRHRVLVGVRSNDCPEAIDSADTLVYPFAIAVGPRPTAGIVNRNTSRSNFPDGCTAAPPSEPTPLEAAGDVGSAG